MAQKTVRKRVLLGCTVFLAVALFVSATEHVADSSSQHTLNLGVEKFQEGADTINRIENGKKLYKEAVELLDSSPIKANQRVFVKQHSSLARSFLSDELQKQKGILPTALRLVTQGVVSFFKSNSPTDDTTTSGTTSTSTSTPTTESENEDTTQQQQESASSTKSTVRRHRDASISKAMNLLEKAGYEYENDDALWTLANMYFHGQYKTKRDLGQAFDMYATLADRSGNGTAQQMVGFMYSTGLGNVVERDEAKAMLYTTFSAWANNTAAELTLGYKYMHGIGTKKSCDDSLFYYKRAADKAHDMYTSGPPLGRTMPPIKGRLTDKDGGTYGSGASGPGEPENHALASNIEDFIEFHRFIAERENADARAAQFQLGILFYTGNAGTVTIPRDYVKAGGYLKKVADGFFTAKMTTKSAILEAKDQRKREGRGRDVEDAALAAALLGKMYWRGEGFDASEQQALEWFTKGAVLDNPVALNGLGVMYQKGVAGLPVNRAAAIECFTKAAELKYPDAKVNLGLIYLDDPKHYIVAHQFFHEAVQMQNFQAVYYLGLMYYDGLGVTKQCEKASRYFKYVAERGDWGDTLFPDSYDAYQAGDVEYAAIGYLQAAERGFEVGQSNFAWILDRELPTTHYLTMLTSPKRSPLSAMAETALVSLASPARLLEMALVYWTRSANQGDVDARVKMGDYYYMGIGTEQDYKKATACYQVAAESELSAMAMWNLGWMHENGVGVTKDFHLAKRWYDQSLSTNRGAVLPVSLSLAKLNARFIWSYLTGGETGGDALSFWSIGGKSSSSGRSAKNAAGAADEASAAGGGGGGEGEGNQGDKKDSGSGWDLNEIGKNGVEKWTNQKQAGPVDDGEEYNDADGTFQQRHRAGAAGGAEGEDDEMFMDDEELVESVVIIGLCMVVGYLMYVRQFRFGNNQGQQQQPNQNENNQNENNNNNNGNGNGNNNNQQQPPVEGLPGDPNAPGRFAYYAAGG
ncbi:ERAD-associated protein [Mortierella sp. AD031]|nr:ERAD-associated protein [Mortierella sp. AD031]